MALSDKARDLRQCTHILEKTGKRCRRWATYGTPDQKCVAHRKEKPDGPNVDNATGTHPCRCKAYKFPHRRGGGLCRWPDEPVVKWNGFQGKRGPFSKDRRAMKHNPEIYAAAIREMARRKKEADTTD